MHTISCPTVLLPARKGSVRRTPTAVVAPDVAFRRSIATPVRSRQSQPVRLSGGRANGVRCQASDGEELDLVEARALLQRALGTHNNELSGPGACFGLGEDGAWDSATVGNPVVRCFLGDDEERWVMYYHGRKYLDDKKMDGSHPESLDSGFVGLATSFDGVNWKRGVGAVSLRGDRTAYSAGTDVGTVLTPNTEDWWVFDTCHVGVGDVQMLNSDHVQTFGGAGVYWMFYHGGDFNETHENDDGTGAVSEGLRRRPGLALSQDGINFARIESDHYTGALFDFGKEGEWDALGCANPQVVSLGKDKLRMYYDGAETPNTPSSIGMATSESGFKWEKAGKVFPPGPPGSFDEAGVSRPWVLPLPPNKGGGFLMYYEGKSKEGVYSIGAATSADGVEWGRNEEPVLAASPDAEAWDAGGVRAPCPVIMAGGKLRLYYSGTDKAGSPTNGIGVATCEAEDLFTFTRRVSQKVTELSDS
eukprot:CAMPEP_0118924826 /NCGR_PEP_ID=MMETSP1169-20130426/2779_1 /TAXON_ID=36882 /ORGANISM="Pyramimonas obovata, Strain CCMP722" /LENGTH=474 /DNA_ID=CAMNT_0006865963 /DNA_START=58 /DNA_END=1482 /DNA_ORIENTATION=+